MDATATTPDVPDMGLLLRGEPESLRSWIDRCESRRVVFCLVVIFIGAGLYGAAMGWWRDPLQALFVAIKFPLILLLTALGNALINAMLAPLLGLNISVRQSFFAILISFAIIAAILGGFSPLLGFLIWNAPPLSADVKSGPIYGLIKLSAVALIGFAGIVGNMRLFQLLALLGKSRIVARRVLIAWLAVNLFLGSQLTWTARPFIGAPELPVAFFRHDALRGNFYENVFHTLKALLHF